jgi:cell division septation protein DedD
MAKGSRRFEFGWLEVVGLIVVFAGGSVAVFTLGFFLGKGLQESQVAGEDRVARLTIETVEEREKVPEPAPEIEPPAPAPTVGLNLAVRPAPSGRRADAAEESSPRPTAQLPRDRPSPTAEAPLPTAAVRVRPTAAPPVRAQPTAVPGIRVKPTATPQVRATPVPAPTARAEASRTMLGGARGTWSVQVNATKDAFTARTIVQDLRRRGFNAYTVDVKLRGELWYRVRVGRFATLQEANEAIGKLRSIERYQRSFPVED